MIYYLWRKKPSKKTLRWRKWKCLLPHSLWFFKPYVMVHYLSHLEQIIISLFPWGSVFTKYYRRLYAMFSGNSSCSQLICSPHIGLQSDLIFHAVMAYLVLYHFHMLWPFQSQVYLCMETSFSVSVFETISGI